MDDTISRQAAVDAICGECQANCIPCESFPCGEIKAIQALPPAQPNLQPTCNNLATDAISRQAAIDAILEQTVCDTKRELVERCDANISDENGWLGGVCIALDTIEDLPSAQSDIAEKLYLCKCYVTDEEGLQHEVIHTGDIRRITGWEI